MTKFYHRPNIGDVVTALPVMRHMGGGVLYLDTLGYYHDLFNNCLSFFRRQPYVTECKLWEGEPFDVNLDSYVGDPMMVARVRTNLVDAHFRAVGLEVPPDGKEPWLTAIPPTERRPVVVHRSHRYRSHLDFSFLAGVPRRDLFVVGFPDEAQPFVDRFGATWVPTPTLDDLATVMASCDVFVGNQSAPVTLAAGLGKPRIMEECPSFPSFTFLTDDHRLLTGNDEENLKNLHQLGYIPTGEPD